MLETYQSVFLASLILFCASIFLMFKKPLYAVMYLLAYRSMFSVAAYLHIPLIGSIPFFAPAFIALWLTLGLYFLYVESTLPNAAPLLPLYILSVLMVLSSLGFVAFASQDTADTGSTILKYVLPIAVYFGAYAGLKTERDYRTLSFMICGMMVVPVTLGIFQALIGVSYDYSLDALVEGMRPVGTIIDPNAYGIFLCMGAFLITPFAMTRGRPGMKLMLSLIVLAIVLSKNRGSWISAIVAVVLGALLFARYVNIVRFFAIGISLAIVASPVVIARFSNLGDIDKHGQSQDTFSERVQQTKHLLAESALSPVFGYGAGSAEQPWGSSTLSRPPHDDYVRMIYEYGLPIAIVYVFFIFHQVVLVARMRAPGTWRIGFAASSFMIYVAIISFAQNLIYDTITYSLIMLMLALAHKTRVISV